MIVRNFKLYFQIRLIAAMCRSISLSIRVYKSICGSLTFHNFFFLQQYLGTYNPVHIFIYEICAKDVWVFNISFRFFFSCVVCLHQLADKLRKKLNENVAFHFSSRLKTIWIFDGNSFQNSDAVFKFSWDSIVHVVLCMHAIFVIETLSLSLCIWYFKQNWIWIKTIVLLQHVIDKLVFFLFKSTIECTPLREFIHNQK